MKSRMIPHLSYFLSSVTTNTNAYISYVCLNSLPYIAKRTISGLMDGLILSIFFIDQLPYFICKMPVLVYSFTNYI